MLDWHKSTVAFVAESSMIYTLIGCALKVYWVPRRNSLLGKVKEPLLPSCCSLGTHTRPSCPRGMAALNHWTEAQNLYQSLCFVANVFLSFSTLLVCFWTKPRKEKCKFSIFYYFVWQQSLCLTLLFSHKTIHIRPIYSIQNHTSK